MRMTPNIVISRIFSAYFVGLPLISAANAEEEWAFFGGSLGQNTPSAERRKAVSRAAAAAQVARSCARCAAGEPLFDAHGRGLYWLDSPLHSLITIKKHPRDMAALEVELYLTHLAVGEKVSTNTQKQALNALVFLYHRVLRKPLGQFRDIERPKRPQRRPLVLSKAEVEQILRVMSGTHQLVATLLFGTGMRLLECLRLRVKDVDLALSQIVVRDGKGWKDRVTMLPQRIKADLEKHLARVREIHRRDVAGGNSTAL